MAGHDFTHKTATSAGTPFSVVGASSEGYREVVVMIDAATQTLMIEELREMFNLAKYLREFVG